MHVYVLTRSCEAEATERQRLEQQLLATQTALEQLKQQQALAAVPCRPRRVVNSLHATHRSHARTRAHSGGRPE